MLNFASYGAIFWAADIIERVGDVEGIELGLLAAIPMALGSTGLLVIGRLSDRSGDRGRWVVIGMLLGAASLAGTALLPAEAGIVTLGVCAFGLLGAVPALWAIPTSLLTSRAMAGGLALVSTIGVSGGIFGPVAVGSRRTRGLSRPGWGCSRSCWSRGRRSRCGCRSLRRGPPRPSRARRRRPRRAG